ncbi:MAG: hypothetical protein JRD89_01460 [Deltaproteobacteria bacterium]|nr:hypothetical protein [Deltaproteobacteria bacterium]
MRKHEEKKIGKNVYRVTQLPFTEGRGAALRLAKIAGPALAEAFGGIDSEVNLEDMDVGNMAGAFNTLLMSMTEEDLKYFTDLFAENSEVETGPQAWVPLHRDIDDYFSEDYSAWLGWMAFAIKVNFASFFGGGQNIARLLKKVKQSQSQPVSTGKAGDSSQVSE